MSGWIGKAQRRTRQAELSKHLMHVLVQVVHHPIQAKLMALILECNCYRKFLEGDDAGATMIIRSLRMTTSTENAAYGNHQDSANVDHGHDAVTPNYQVQRPPFLAPDLPISTIVTTSWP